MRGFSRYKNTSGTKAQIVNLYGNTMKEGRNQLIFSEEAKLSYNRSPSPTPENSKQYFRAGNNCKLLLHLKTKHVFENFGVNCPVAPTWLRAYEICTFCLQTFHEIFCISVAHQKEVEKKVYRQLATASRRGVHYTWTQWINLSSPRHNKFEDERRALAASRGFNICRLVHVQQVHLRFPLLAIAEAFYFITITVIASLNLLLLHI